MAEICSANSRVDNRSRQLAGLLLGSPPAARLHNRTRDVQFFSNTRENFSDRRAGLDYATLASRSCGVEAAGVLR
jgi:hypothetical protein